MRVAERHHWLNTIVGVLDTAFHLTEHEQLETIKIVRGLLEGIRIPERSVAASLPAPVALEVESGFYTIQLAHVRDSGLLRPVRSIQAHDVTVSAEAWRDALVGMLLTGYPDMAPMERLLATKVFGDLLLALGVPERAAAFFPEAVVRAYRTSPEGMAEIHRPQSR